MLSNLCLQIKVYPSCQMNWKCALGFSPLAWLLEICFKYPLFAIQALPSFALQQFLYQGQNFDGQLSGLVHALSLGRLLSPQSSNFNEASFPLEPACFSPAFTLHAGSEQSPLLWYCRVNNAALLILGGVQERGRRGRLGPTFSVCWASGNWLSSPGAFVLYLDASDWPGWVSEGQMCLAHFVLNELTVPSSPPWTHSPTIWVGTTAVTLNTILWLDSAPLSRSSRRCWGLWAREVWSEMHVCRNGWGFPFA